jgi:hypothetical protein
VRADFITGAILDNPLTNAATTLNSTQLIALPAVDSTQHMVIVLDPTGAGNGPEVVWVTAQLISKLTLLALRALTLILWAVRALNIQLLKLLPR